MTLAARMRWMVWWAAMVMGVGAVRGVDGGAPVRWWKGNLHTHTLWSDGDDFPEMVAGWYREHGYHFLALSDHNVLSQGERWITVTNILSRAKGDPWRAAGHQAVDPVARYVERYGTHWVERRTEPKLGLAQVRLKPFDEYRALLEEAGRFLMIQAEELTSKARNGRAIHLGAVNLHEVVEPQEGESVAAVITRSIQAVEAVAGRTGRPVLVHVNHPNYQWGVTAEDLAAVASERFVEIWNGVEIDNDPGDALHPGTEEIWDIANTLRLAALGDPPLFGVATDDAHDHHGTKSRARPGRGWVMVRSAFLTPEFLIRALQAGEFHASTGVVLEDVQWDGASRRLSLRIRPEGGETFVTRFVGTRQGVSLRGRPRRDSQGNAIETTLDYAQPGGPRIGEVLAEVRGLEPAYVCRGDELYVRAVVTSSGSPSVPGVEDSFKRAWTQPVGWKAGAGPRK